MIAAQARRDHKFFCCCSVMASLGGTVLHEHGNIYAHHRPSTNQLMIILRKFRYSV